ncbi:hypothetical protein MHBO_000479 [Bonamia ostreae]|uniref:ATP synthase protein MI25 n=1 Tax=Bonamia ostreae TaxID=126728 RepID=A0ABV2AFP4_9EUKA
MLSYRKISRSPFLKRTKFCLFFSETPKSDFAQNGKKTIFENIKIEQTQKPYAFWAIKDNLNNLSKESFLNGTLMSLSGFVLIYYLLHSDEKENFKLMSDAELSVCKARKDELSALEKLHKIQLMNYELLEEIEKLNKNFIEKSNKLKETN